nr:glycosyltransferase family 9 protein [Kineococcus aurantiacus]
MRDRTAVPDGPVVVHPGAAFPARRWPVDRWREVVAHLVGQGLDVVVTGTADERDLGAALAAAGARDRCGASTLDELASLVASARLMLSGDTGTAHLATAFATPSVVLFGPTPPAWWGPAIDADRHTVLWHGDPGARDYVGDPHGTGVDPTLARTTVEEVICAAAHLLAR